MITKFAKITNDLASLGDGIANDQKVRKVIRALPPSWEVKFITLKELNDKKEIELIALIENLKTHDMERKAREKVPHKKKTLTFKSSPSISYEEDDDQEDDEDLFLLVKNVRRMYNNAKFNNRRRWQGNLDMSLLIA